jgi:hemerythrin
MPWVSSLSVGVKIIDDQHKQLFEKADKLFEAGKNHQAKEYLSEMLDFLSDYTKKHFADEETYMRSIHYPGYEEQRKAHSDFIAQVKKLSDEYKASGGNILVILRANQIIVDWLTKHISVMDKKIGQYANSLQK